MLGFTDYDINPQSMAQRYVEDDQRILNGEVDRISTWSSGSKSRACPIGTL